MIVELPPEPTITINGVRLTEGQAMTVRVAVMNMQMTVSDPDKAAELGPIAQGYSARLGEIMRIIFTALILVGCGGTPAPPPEPAPVLPAGPALVPTPTDPEAPQ